jgi:ABC-type Na+ efflux pump permease subunit
VAWKELMLTRRNLKTYLTSYGFVVAIWGIFIPGSMVDSIWHGNATMSILTFGYLSFFLASGQTIQAFVGERMQKTLGTLLTTRLSDTAIYLGKVLAIIMTGYTVMLLVFILHLTTLWFLRIYDWKFPYDALQLVVMLVLPIFALLYTSALGVYISLRSTNIRGQHFLNLFMGLPVLAIFYRVLQSLSWPSLFMSMAIFGLVCAAITMFSIGRFNRQRLILQ